MLFKRDMKDYLLLSSVPVFDLLRLTSRTWCLPSIIVYPTTFCNYNCIMCQLFPGGKGRIQNEQTMDFSLMSKLINQAASFLVKPKVHFSGLGEPLVYKEIKSVMRLCREHKIKWSMTTNAFFLQRYIDDIINNNCYGLNISIHGDATTHDKITGVEGAFSRSIAAIKQLHHAKKSKHKNRPLIAVNCVISNANVQKLKQNLDIFLQLPINSVTFQHLSFMPQELSNRDDFLILDKDLFEKVASFLDYVEANRFPIKVNVYPKIKKNDIAAYYADEHAGFNNSCILPWLTLRVYPNGDVKLCEVLLGNIQDEPLGSIVNNRKTRELRNRIRKGRFNSPMCFRCCHRHYYN